MYVLCLILIWLRPFFPLPLSYSLLLSLYLFTSLSFCFSVALICSVSLSSSSHLYTVFYPFLHSVLSLLPPSPSCLVLSCLRTLPLSSNLIFSHLISCHPLPFLGMGDVHDGVNFMRAACVIAVEKAKASFEPMLEVCSVYLSVYVSIPCMEFYSMSLFNSSMTSPAEFSLTIISKFYELTHTHIDRQSEMHIRILTFM